MYLLINEQRHTCTRRKTGAASVEFFSVTPAPEEISGKIQLFDDGGFLMSVDDADGYERKFMTGAILTLTNEPEQEPETDPEEPEEELTVWDELAAAYEEGVNSIDQ